MEATTIAQIEERLRQLSPEKRVVVLDFVSCLAERQLVSKAFQTMLASEPVLRRDWGTSEEDEAWRDL
jgi:hypothetical protein